MTNIDKRVVLVAGLAGAAVVLSGCGLAESARENGNGHVKAVSYDTGAQGKQDSEVRLPSWVPDQALNAQEVVRTTGSERILRFTADDQSWLAGCGPSPAANVRATLTASWWPAGQEARTDRACESWYVHAEGATVYAYRPESVAQPPN